jgi:hypothetical protein
MAGARDAAGIVKSFALFMSSWIAGVVAYFGLMYFVFDEVPAALSGDVAAVLFWSLFFFALTYVVLYLPLLRAVHRRLGGVQAFWPFPLVATMLGIVPTALIVFSNGGGVSGLFSVEAGLFFGMFGAIGVVAGVGYVMLHRRNRIA